MSLQIRAEGGKSRGGRACHRGRRGVREREEEGGAPAPCPLPRAGQGVTKPWAPAPSWSHTTCLASAAAALLPVSPRWVRPSRYLVSLHPYQQVLPAKE